MLDDASGWQASRRRSCARAGSVKKLVNGRLPRQLDQLGAEMLLE
jgi:hypothetical protein